ncbi:MAG: ankyrin repeat domain-containing protein [Smithellaceae bacterium]
MANIRHCTFCLIVVFVLYSSPLSAQAADDSRSFSSGSKDRAHQDMITPDQFLAAARNGSLQKVKAALAQGIDINVQNEIGESALHLAKGTALVKFLITQGANVNLPDKQAGMTPLFFQDVPVARLLIAAGADVNARSHDGNTPLHWFAYSNYLEGVQYLVSVGADIHAVNKDGRTALDIARRFGNRVLVNYLRSIDVEKRSDNN